MPNTSSGSVKVFYPLFNREELLALLRRRIPPLQSKLPLRRVVLFGSYARGRQTAASDIDLLIVYAGEPREDAYALVRRTLNIRGLQPHLYTQQEYEQVRATVERMVRGGIPVVES